MLFEKRKISDIEHGPQTLMNASDAIKKKDAGGNYLASEEFYITKGVDAEINGSGIQTRLIQETGRFAESYASDLICTLSDLQPFLETKDCPFENNRWVIGAGIRDCGVDHNAFIMSRLEDTRHGLYDYVYPNYNYRKILVIDIKDKVIDSSTVFRTIELKDVTNEIIRIAPEDQCEEEKIG